MACTRFDTVCGATEKRSAHGCQWLMLDPGILTACRSVNRIRFTGGGTSHRCENPRPLKIERPVPSFLATAKYVDTKHSSVIVARMSMPKVTRASICDHHLLAVWRCAPLMSDAGGFKLPWKCLGSAIVDQNSCPRERDRYLIRTFMSKQPAQSIGSRAMRSASVVYPMPEYPRLNAPRARKLAITYLNTNMHHTVRR